MWLEQIFVLCSSCVRRERRRKQSVDYAIANRIELQDDVFFGLVCLLLTPRSAERTLYFAWLSFCGRSKVDIVSLNKFQLFTSPRESYEHKLQKIPDQRPRKEKLLWFNLNEINFDNLLEYRADIVDGRNHTMNLAELLALFTNSSDRTGLDRESYIGYGSDLSKK